MKFFRWAADGGAESHVTGFFIVEIKWLFSIVVLHFRNGTREAFHSHAFNALTWFLRGKVEEHRIPDPRTPEVTQIATYLPSWKPKFTSRDNHHKSVQYRRHVGTVIPWAVVEDLARVQKRKVRDVNPRA